MLLLYTVTTFSIRVVLLSRTASLSLAVIAVTVKIQMGRMTMIDLGDEEEVVWGRFSGQWSTNSDSAPQETPLKICRLAISHCEVNRGQWPQVTLVDLETHMMQGQGVTVSHVLTPITSTIPIQVNRTTPSCVYSWFRWNLVEGCSSYDVITSWPDLTIFFFTQSCAKDAHKLWKISARCSKRCNVQLRKTHGGLHHPPPPPLARVNV